MLQLMKIIDMWTECLESGGQIDVIYTDLEKAFDKVPHNLLIQKLRNFYINEVCIKWIESFLANRRQRVNINGSYSEWARVISGIPQGSVLGPLLFIIYINDLVAACNSGSEVYLFADDAKLFKHVKSEIDKDILQNDLTGLQEWIKKWLLKLNIEKCKVVSYGRSNVISSDYYIDNIKLEKLDKIKDLGVLFDSKLSFREHVMTTTNKAYSILGIIKRNFSCLLYTSDAADEED